MSKHEQKICGRCQAAFECKVGDISHCQCGNIRLTDAEQQYILGKFSDCLCLGCLDALKQQFHA